MVATGRSVRIHARAGAGGQPLRRRGARRLRSAGARMKVENLSTVLDVPAGELRAVDGISFELKAGECFALVGESGSGKSMTALSLMRLLPEAGRIAGGRVELGGVDLLGLPEAAMRAVRGKRVSMIFQEPATALNPVLTVGQQIAE